MRLIASHQSPTAASSLGLGCASVSARMLFASATTAGSPMSHRAPAHTRGLALAMLFDLALPIAFAAGGAAPMDMFFYLATIGTLTCS